VLDKHRAEVGKVVGHAFFLISKRLYRDRRRGDAHASKER
jgi:hypothetical protein